MPLKLPLPHRVDSGSFFMPNQQVEHSFLPTDCLISKAVRKRLTVTLAWMLPISAQGRNYRLARLFFQVPGGEKVASGRTEAGNIPSMRGIVQCEIFEGRRASTYEKGESLVICVKCSKEGALRKPVKYAIAVSLENPDGYLPIYQDVKARLRPSFGAIAVPPLRS